MKTIPCDVCGGTGRVPDQTTLGKQLRRRRELKHVTLRAHAIRMGISAAYLCDLEHGRRVWKRPLLDSYKSALNVNTKS